MALTIDGLCKRYRGGIWGLRDFSLTVASGIVGILGPNGAGKSTLMRILATVTRPTHGTVTWDDQDVAMRPEAVRSILGYLPQDFGIYPNLSAREFLDYLAAAKGLPARTARSRIDDLLNLTHLAEVCRRPLRSFSGGMRQRVGIAQALLNDPRLLIVDEPTAGLDPEERVRFRHLLADLAENRLILLSTHIVSDVEACAQTIAIISRGRLIRLGTPEALLEPVSNCSWEWVVAEQDVAAARARFRIASLIRKRDGVQLRVLAEARPAAAAVPVAATLEDAYLHALSGPGEPP